ncbi:MAG: alpha/beta fold hydrolase [Candidatus Binataceae bacterium]|nr:alpha/beta fold hydrolase [Candidatus Binataceae bacterium]
MDLQDVKYMKVEKFIEVGGGLQMHYYERGVKTNPPIVFLHGGGPGALAWANWRQNLDYFAEHGYWCLAPDALGYGLSSKPEDARYNVEFLASGVAGFLKAHGIRKAILVGNSLGGATALHYALHKPAVEIEKIVLVGPAGIGPRSASMDNEVVRLLFQIGRDRTMLTKENIRKLFEGLIENKSLITDELVAQRVEAANGQPTVVFQTLQIGDLAPRLNELKIPILAFWGANDRVVPPTGALELASRCERSRVLILSHCGHSPQIEMPALFNRMSVDFCKET